MFDTISTAILTISLATIAYHYAGYPIIVGLLATLMGQREKTHAAQPSVSLIVAAYNEASTIRDKIENAKTSGYPDLEIIVVTDGSTDGTDRIAQSFDDPKVIVHHDAERRGKGQAMNHGASRATGEILVFSDANAFLADNALQRLVACFGDPKVGLASGRKVVVKRSGCDDDTGFARSEGLYWKYEDFVRRSEDALGISVASVGELLALRRDLFEAIPSSVVNDDAYLVLKVLQSGHSIRYAREASVWEHGSKADRDETIRRRRIAAGRWKLLADPTLWPIRRPDAMLALVSHKWLRLLLPFLFAMAFASNAYALSQSPSDRGLWGLLLLQSAFHAASIAGQNSDRTGTAGKIARLCYFLNAVNFSAFLGFLDWITGRTNALWTKAER